MLWVRQPSAQPGAAADRGVEAPVKDPIAPMRRPVFPNLLWLASPALSIHRAEPEPAADRAMEAAMLRLIEERARKYEADRAVSVAVAGLAVWKGPSCWMRAGPLAACVQACAGQGTQRSYRALPAIGHTAAGRSVHCHLVLRYQPAPLGTAPAGEGGSGAGAPLARHVPQLCRGRGRWAKRAAGRRLAR